MGPGRPWLAAIPLLALGLGTLAAAAEPEPGNPLAKLPPLVGVPRSEVVEPGDTLLDIAFRNHLGFERVSRLNPGVDAWIPDPGTVVHLPTRHVLPDVPRKGLVVNVPEMQLYDFTRPNDVEIFALAIGDQMDPSLVGEFRVGRKREKPAWHVPKSILAEKPELPPVVPPGPDNPLGDHWMTIGSTSYGIHGTNNRWSIGREATHGCLRLYNDDIARLYARTPQGTPLRIVYQTVKLGRSGDEIWVEAHPDRYGRDPERVANALTRLAELGLVADVDMAALRRAIDEARGEPTPVGRSFRIDGLAPAAATSGPSSRTSLPRGARRRRRCARRRPPAARPR
jgi:L,D-transpeptidase ErfK/SrfK